MSAPSNYPCPLCGMGASVESTAEPERTRVSCSRCGKFTSDWGIRREVSIPADWVPYVSAATRQAHTPIHLTRSNWRSHAEVHRARTVSQKIETLLQYIGLQCGKPSGAWKSAPAFDYPLFDCADEEEYHQYVRHLMAKDLLHGVKINDQGTGLQPTIEGWQALEPRARIGGETDRCFVAMWFHDDLDGVWQNGMEPAIVECGFKAYRQKEDLTNKAVIDRIFAEIRRSHFVVADFTGQRNSVYYEVGFASGLGREIISCCKEGEADKLAFDTRHLGHIVWKNAEDLREKLANSIRANIIPKG